MTERFAVDAVALDRYLRSNRWRIEREIPNEHRVFRAPDTRDLVWVPITNDYEDFDQLITRAVHTIAKAEKKDVLRVLDDLQTIAVGDVVFTRSYNRLDHQDYTLPLDEGIALHQTARQLALYGAASARERRPVHPRRHAAEVSGFVRDLRLAQSQPGSYIVRLVSPLVQVLKNTSPNKLPLIAEPTEVPFARRAVTELMNALDALKDAASDNVSRGKFIFGAFQEGVSRGVSANLCEAIVPSVGLDNRPIEVGATLSFIVPRTDNLSLRPVLFEADQFDHIRAAAIEFRRRNPEPFTVQGFPRVLRHEQNATNGQIEISTPIDGRSRIVRIALAADAYTMAVEAHKSNKQVSISGELVLMQNGGFILQKPHSVHIYEQGDLFDSDGKEN